ncbi:beaten path IIIc [Carabus blaptoides fortunei]
MLMHRVCINVDVSKSGANEVVLRDVQLHMAGKYRCEVSADAPSFHTSMVSSYMHVVYLPEGEPKMVMEKQRYAVGDILRGNCSSPPSNPPTNLTWIVNGKKINESFLLRYPVDGGEMDPQPDILVIGEGGAIENHQRQVTVIGLELDIEGSTFQYAKVRIECEATMFQLYRSKVELVLEEERPRLASVLGTRESSLGSSSQWSGQCLWIMALCLLASVASR